eukprot:TRINITY_DN21183_c0_g1_i1.p1 TRINITY_DN21183_c0_g1~~TRINITY_DN21183_c0_g1_i1.p1  ORF type:complete len:112 (+),score=17.28 TRINITY_DN21183_c0_g1_i1:51-338(+)
MAPKLEMMPKIIKMPQEQLEAEKVDVTRIRLETQCVWVAQGNRSNRLLYAMKKRGDIAEANCVVVEGPPPKVNENDEEVEPETYGSDHVKIQLIP